MKTLENPNKATVHRLLVAFPQMEGQLAGEIAKAVEASFPDDVRGVVDDWIRTEKYPPKVWDFRARVKEKRELRERKLHPELDPFGRDVDAHERFLPGMSPWAREEMRLILKGELRWTPERRGLVWADGRNAPLPRDAR